MMKKKKHSRNFAPKMADINEIAVTYRQHLARLPKYNTRTDYSKRLAMLERWSSMHGITRVEEIDFLQFLDWVFYSRSVSPRTRNNYHTWCRSFCSWLRLEPNIKFAASLRTKSAKSKHDVNVIRRMPGRFLTFAVLKKKSTLL